MKLGDNQNYAELSENGVLIKRVNREPDFYPWGDIGKGGGDGGSVDKDARAAAAAAQDTADNAASMAEEAQTTANTALDVAYGSLQFDNELDEPIEVNFQSGDTVSINFHCDPIEGNGGNSFLKLTLSSEHDPGGECVAIQTLENNFMKFYLLSGIIVFHPDTPSQKTLNLYNLAS